MTFRITQQILINQAVRNAGLRTQAIGKLQSQITSGLRVTKPSDDPAIIPTLLARKATDARLDVDLENISSARSKLNHSVSQLTEASLVLTSAREIALSAAQAQERETLAQQVDALIERLLSIANASDGGQQLYAGAASHDRPFEIAVSDPDGKPRVIQYLGASLRSQVLVAPDTPVDTLYSGEEVFQQTDREPSVYLGVTGATAGFGTDSATGQGELLVTHTLTTYGGGAGVNPGASSPAGDAIIGAHTLTIENDPILGRVVRLDNGGRVPFNALSVDLEVAGPDGASVFVDLSGVPVAFTGSVPITADGTISVDGGVSAVPINFSANQTLTHAVTGEVTNVNSINIQRTGTDRIEYVGTVDAFEALVQLRDQLRDSQGISAAEMDAIMQHRIKDLQRVQHQILSVVGEQSVTLENLDALENRTGTVQLDTRLAIGDLENADMAEVILQLQNEQNLLQFVYASAATSLNTSLLDFIS